jgi:hypothetical protein
MNIVMGKVRQRNWLLIITAFLLFASILVLFMTTRKRLGVGVCEYGGAEYVQGQVVSNYDGRKDCVCTWSGEIVCGEDSLVISYENFSTENLVFTYSFRNFLDKDEPNISDVVLADVNQQGQTLELILEREVFCSQEGQVPVQTAMYKQEDNSLTLTTVTDRDESVYSRVCLIANTFKFANFTLPEGSEFSEYSLLYQGDTGQEFKLNSCFVNGKLYAKGDVFKDAQGELLCTCEETGIECEEL